MKPIILFALLITITSNLMHAGSGASTPRPTRNNSLTQSFIEFEIETPERIETENGEGSFSNTIEDRHIYAHEYNEDGDAIQQQTHEFSLRLECFIKECEDDFYDNDEVIEQQAPESSPQVLTNARALNNSPEEDEDAEENWEAFMEMILRRQMLKSFNKKISPNSRYSPYSATSPSSLHLHILPENEEYEDEDKENTEI